MLARQLTARLQQGKKSVLLLGPRQVGKSTLIRFLKPQLTLNLMDESLYLGYAKDPAKLKRELLAVKTPRLVAIDEIQRVPALLNIIQLLLDEGSKCRFLLSGSSARKLKRGHANLLPGRVVIEYLDPLSYWEMGSKFNLDKVLRVGSLPGIYLEDDNSGNEILSSYGQIYLREEIQAEALTRNLGSYARFLDVAAEASGQWINYSKMASDNEIPKETLRRFYTLLEDTLIIHRIAPYRPASSKRRVSQRERFVFFDLGVRNALLGIHKSVLSPLEKGRLFEQWILLQLIAFAHAKKKEWRMSSFRTDTGIEVDWVLETSSQLIGIECKLGKQASAHDFNGLRVLENYSRKSVRKIVVYTGSATQQFNKSEIAIPYSEFLDELLPSI